MDLIPNRKRSLSSLGLEPDLDDGDNSQGKKKPVDTDPPMPPNTATSEAKATSLMGKESIVAKIAANMAARDLWNLRSSGPIWNTAFIPQLKSKQKKITLNGKSRRTIDLIKVIQSSLDNPFTIYSFDLDSEGEGISTRDRDCFPNFLSTIGSTITKLELSWKRAADLSVSDLRKVIFDWTPQLTELILTSDDHRMPNRDDTIALSSSESLKTLPNLKLINVWVTAKAGNEGKTGNWLNVAFSQLISDVVQSAVGLKHLYLLDDSNNNMKFMRHVITGLLQNRTRSHIHKLKDLSLSSTRPVNLPNATLRDLIELGTGEQRGSSSLQLQLESFTVGVQSWMVPGDETHLNTIFRLLHTFLGTQAPTLKELVHDGVGRASSSTRNKVMKLYRLPGMEQLNKLKVYRSGLGRDEIQFGDDGEFRDTYPQLSHFSYEHVPLLEGPGPSLTDTVERLHHPGVTDLIFESNVYDGTDINNFTSFRTVFISLTRLELKFSIEQNSFLFDTPEFAKIWTTWPVLRVLHITLAKCDLDMDLDTLISGIPRRRLERLKCAHKALFPGDGDPETTSAQDSLREILASYNKAWPGISDLKSLQEFVFTFDDNDEEGKGSNSDSDYDIPQLTDMGGYCGIGMASPTLQRVVIQGKGKNLVSEQCLAFMRKKFGLLAELSL